jgi:hypothetical protein
MPMRSDTDMILSVNQQPVRDTQDAAQKLKQAEQQKQALLVSPIAAPPASSASRSRRAGAEPDRSKP